MAAEIKFGILGCTNIARTLMKAMRVLPEVKIHAIASRTLENAQSFAAANNVPEETKLYGSYEELLDDDKVDAVYIPLPTGLHVEWVLKAAAKEKHVLLEKPPAHTVKELDLMLDVMHGKCPFLIAAPSSLDHGLCKRMEEKKNLRSKTNKFTEFTCIKRT